MKKATELPNKFAGLIKQPLTKKQKRERARYEREHRHRYGSGVAEKRARKRSQGKTTTPHQKRAATGGELKSP